MKKVAVALVSVLALLIAILYVLVDIVPPVSMTVTVMEVTKEQILKYAKDMNVLPSGLSQLPLKKDKTNSLNDGWGRSIRYEVDSNGIISLTSLGKDGRPGGEGNAADIICSFPAKQADGSWSPELVDWTKRTIPQWEK